MSLDSVTGPDVALSSGGAMAKSPLTLTPAAAARVRELLAQPQPQPEALIVSVTSKGCSGLRYDIQYLDRLADAPKFADIVTQDGATVVIDPKAALYIIGATMDYKIDKMKTGFDFTNPNETGRCGCGESFSVEKK